MAEPHWTPKLVAAYLADAADTLRRLPDRRIGGYASAWPEIVRDYREAFGWHVAEVRPIPPSPKAIDRMDETLRWLWWLELAHQHGIDRTTAWRRWSYALVTIAARLNAEGVATLLQHLRVQH